MLEGESSRAYSHVLEVCVTHITYLLLAQIRRWRIRVEFDNRRTAVGVAGGVGRGEILGLLLLTLVVDHGHLLGC